MESKKNPFFKLEDFQVIEIHISGLNITSQVKISSDDRGIQLIETLSDGIWVELPAKSCAMGHTLSLNFLTRKDQIENETTVVGVVEEIETNTAGRLNIKLKFRQYSQPEWDLLLNYISGKQNDINQFIKNTRK